MFKTLNRKSLVAFSALVMLSVSSLCANNMTELEEHYNNKDTNAFLTVLCDLRGIKKDSEPKKDPKEFTPVQIKIVAWLDEIAKNADKTFKINDFLDVKYRELLNGGFKDEEDAYKKKVQNHFYYVSARFAAAKEGTWDAAKQSIWMFRLKIKGSLGNGPSLKNYFDSETQNIRDDENPDINKYQYRLGLRNDPGAYVPNPKVERPLPKIPQKDGGAPPPPPKAPPLPPRDDTGTGTPPPPPKAPPLPPRDDTGTGAPRSALSGDLLGQIQNFGKGGLKKVTTNSNKNKGEDGSGNSSDNPDEKAPKKNTQPPAKNAVGGQHAKNLGVPKFDPSQVTLKKTGNRDKLNK